MSPYMAQKRAVKTKGAEPRRRRKPRRATLELLATNVRTMRAERGYSQERLADEAGLHRTYVGDVERCEHNPTLGMLEALADAFGVQPADLLQRRPIQKTKRAT